MRKRISATVTAVSISTVALLALLVLLGSTSPQTLAAPLALSVSEVDPPSISNDLSTTIVLSGTDFDAVISGTQVITPPTVRLDSTELPDVGWVMSTTLTSTVPAGFPVGVYTVTVENPDAASASLPDALTVRYPTPTLETVSPISGTYGQSIVLTITGTHFVPTPTLSIGGTPCPNLGLVSSTTLTVTVPSDLLPGIHDLTVHNPGPETPWDDLPAAFALYSPDPTVTAIAPREGANDLDTQVVITGTGFVPTPTVALADTPLNDVTWVSDTQLTAQVPWGMDPLSYNLTLANPGPGTPTAGLTDAFTVTEGIGVWNVGELYGGSVEGLALNPVTPTTLYAASFHVGLFRSRDGGDSWSFQFASGGGMMHPVVDPHSPNRLYVHGEFGLYRSDDEGDSWTALDPQFPYTGRPSDRCTSVWIHPYVHPVSDTVYAIACDEYNQGVIRSDDHGQTWESATEGITDTQVTALAFHPEDPETMYAGTGNGHIFVSSNGGITWTYASQPVGCVGAMAVNPHGDHELWVASDSSHGDPCVLRESTNAELTSWTTLTASEGCSWPQPSIHFDRNVPGRAFVAGMGFQGLKTTDDGGSWTPLSPRQDSIVQDLAPHPTQTDTVYLGDKWEGVFKTTDGGDTWDIADQGLTALYPLQMDVHRDQPGVIYARLNNERIYRGMQGGETWQRLPLSRAASVQIDPMTTTRVYAGQSGNPAHVHVSDDEGQTWTPSAPLPKSEAYCDGWTFPWSLYAVPRQPGTLLLGAQHHCDPLPHPGNLYRSTGYGVHWERVYTYTYHEYEMPIDLAAHPLTPTTIYAAIPNGEDGLLRSTDGGQTWERIGESYEGMAFARSVAIEPAPPYRIFVLTSWQSAHLYVSGDVGLTWTEVTALPHPEKAEQLLFTDARPPMLYLYAATSEGGLSRLNIGEEPWEWDQAVGLLGQVPVYALATVADTDRVFLYAGTTGGHVADTRTQARAAATEGTLVNAGVYRYTTRNLHVYLPLVLRSYGP
ncbi:MAG: IPT/TIG domain-containing protein [Anaerolineae bacterium]